MNDSDYNPRKRHVVFQKLNITPSSMPIISLIASIKNVRANGLDLSPDYQRGYIWSNEYKDQLILSIILNYPIGNIVINNLDQPNQRNARQELVDGKQRLTTIFRFMEVGNVGQWLDSYDDWFQLSKKTSDQAKEIINRIVGDSDPDGLARMHRAKRLSFSDLPSSIQMNFNTYNIPVYTMQAADPAQIRNYFKVLQNQEKLRAGEIINALPDNPMSMYFDRIPAEAFLTRTGCSNFKRAELEKVYYSVLGTWFDKIQINASDKTVISFVENMPDLTETQIKHINNLNSGIIAISRLPGAIQKIRSSKRMLKLVFGLALHAPGYFSTTDAFSRLQAVCELSSKLAAFNTSDSDQVAFSKYFGDEYTLDKENFETRKACVYRALFWSTSRVSSRTAYVDAMEILRRMFTESFDSAFEYYTAHNIAK